VRHNRTKQFEFTFSPRTRVCVCDMGFVMTKRLLQLMPNFYYFQTVRSYSWKL